MVDLFVSISVGVVCIVTGFFVAKWLFKSKISTEKQFHSAQIKQFESQLSATKDTLHQTQGILQKQIIQVQSEREQIRTEKEVLAIQLSKKEADFDHLLERNKEQKAEVENLQKKFTLEFENLANKILEEKTAKFTQQNQENLKTILAPLQDKIQNFEKKVEDTHKESIDYHAALRQQILGLKDLNVQMNIETMNLTKALKGDNKMQGNWGELVLERVLEKSGLEKGREYDVQQNFIIDGQKRIPDVVVHLPEGKKMIIDSKVSLVAYERFVNEEDENLKKSFLNEHLFSLKKHVEQLSSKNYQALYTIESPDFVLLFIPIEAAFATALNQDNFLYNKAFEQNIIIVTPTTLLATLRTIDSIWTNQKQQQNAYEIARQAGALYDKFYGFVLDMEKIGKKLDDAKTEYSQAMNKLVEGKGNLVNSVQKLKIMGAKTNKTLPENLLNSEINSEIKN
jgi:DNA recombination protein RmuC